MKCTDLSKAALLEQVAEECTELGHAALKLARKYRNENPTPVTEEEAYANLKEEWADMLLSMTVLDHYYNMDCNELKGIMDNKYASWNQRLEDAAHEN